MKRIHFISGKYFDLFAISTARFGRCVGYDLRRQDNAACRDSPRDAALVGCKIGVS